MGVPGGAETNVVIAVAVPVVDIQAVLVEVTDARDVASIGAYFARSHPRHWESSFAARCRAYTLFSLYFIREQPLQGRLRQKRARSSISIFYRALSQSV